MTQSPLPPTSTPVCGGEAGVTILPGHACHPISRRVLHGQPPEFASRIFVNAFHRPQSPESAFHRFGPSILHVLPAPVDAVQP